MDWSPLFISMKTAILATVITFFIGSYSAQKVMRTKGKLALILDGLFTLPLVLPPTVAGFLLLMLLGKYGPMGQLLSGFGIRIIFTWSATVIAAVVIAFPLMYRSAKAAFEQIDQNLLFAGRTLGMSEIEIFWKISMPLALPGIMSGAILAFARSLGEFGATLMIAGNIPKVTQTIPVAIYMSVQGDRIEKAVVWVIIIVIFSFVAIFLMNYFANKRREYCLKEGSK